MFTTLTEAEPTAILDKRNMDAQPTIRIRQDVPFNVFLNADRTFPGPYADQPGRFAR